MKNIVILLFIVFVGKVFSQVQVLPEDDGRTIEVPVIFHVLDVKGISIHDSIPSEILKEEIHELNLDFSAKNNMDNLHENYKHIIGNPNFHFYIKDTLIDGFKEKGILRYNNIIDFKNVELINPDKLLNIVIGDHGSSSFVLTEHQTPKVVYVYYDSGFGEESKTITHEVGHYFGLWHVWGGTNCRKIKWPWDNKTDYISDTPKQRNCTNWKKKKKCPPRNFKKKPNYNNFMDYSQYRCFFTKEQARLLRKKTIKYKNHLYENSL